MNFEQYLDQAWSNHADDSSGVAESFQTGLDLAQTAGDLLSLTMLATHVLGEHLSRWENGQTLLQKVLRHPHFDATTEVANAVKRSKAVLQIGSGLEPDLGFFSISDQVRILAVAATTVSQIDWVKSKTLFERALAAAVAIVDAKDPANRALAISGNNLACALEEKKGRTLSETQLMISAAKTGRTYWQTAGTWLEVATAEYRLAMTYLEAGDAEAALHHAQTNIEMCRANSAGDRNRFFGYQALALAERARRNSIGFEAAVRLAKDHYQQLPDEDRAYCSTGLARLG